MSPGGAVVLHGEARIEVARAVPLRTFLDAGVPNPFNPSTALRFGVSQAGPGELVIYDARGQHVRTLWRAPRAEPGFYRLVWDGREDGGRRFFTVQGDANAAPDPGEMSFSTTVEISVQKGSGREAMWP